MEEENKLQQIKSSNKGLVVVLIVLVIAIVGLVVGIIVVRILNGDNDTPVSTSEEVCSDYNTVEDIQLCIEKKVDDNTTVDEWAGYYQDAIDAAMLEDDSALAAGLLSAKADYLVGWGRCNDALEELSNIDETLYSRGMLVELYRDGIHYADLCGDNEVSQKFTMLYNNLVKGVQND